MTALVRNNEKPVLAQGNELITCTTGLCEEYRNHELQYRTGQQWKEIGRDESKMEVTVLGKALCRQ